MKIKIAACLVAVMFCPAFAMGDEILIGNLNSGQVWNRTFGIPLTDSGNDGVGYQIFQFVFDAIDPDIQIEVTSFTNPGADTTMYYFLDEWDVNDPLGATNTANALVYDDDGGTGLLSAIGSNFGDPAQAVAPDQVYGIIVSGFGPADLGDLTVQITTTANVTVVPEPATASLGLLALASIGMAFRRRR